jgi:hypothetical protein
MLRSLFWGVLGACASMSPGYSDTSIKVSYPYILAATTEVHSYGLWLRAPAKGCRSVRYVVTADGARLGFSGPLTPGEGAVVRIGYGFAQGDHTLSITGFGCGDPPGEARRVLLGKPSPDHGWRAN